MEMIKVFISHSSDDVNYVDSLVNILGKNSLSIDKYCFESGERTIDEILKAIDNSSIFVLLLSRSSLSKAWVQEEIKIIKTYYDSGALKKFCPYIIDKTIDYSYKEIPNWISENWNLRENYSLAPFLARKIDEEINKLRWSRFPEIEKKERTFVSRDIELGKLTSKYYEKDLKQRRAIIVSGIPSGIGRRRLLTEFLHRIETNKEKTYNPFSIALKSGDSIENFILQLNKLFMVYSNEEIMSFLTSASIPKRLNKALELLNEVSIKKEKIFIRDDGACIKRDGGLSSWFSDIITSSSIDHTLLFIASRNRFTHFYDFPQIVSLDIAPLDIKPAIILLKSFLENYNKSISEADANFFIERTGRMPSLISLCADLINERGVELAKRDQKVYEYKGDDLTKSIISDYKHKNQHTQVLLLLSDFDYLTYGEIREITNGFIDDVDDILSEFYSLSIYELFGSDNEYIRMNPILADFVNRSKLMHDDELWGRIRERAHDIVEREDFNDAGLGFMLKKIEYEIKGNTNNLSRAHAIPSIALKALNDEYRKQTPAGYRNVVSLCIRLLENNKNYYSEISYEIYRLLCSAYAQLGDEEFFENRHHLNSYDNRFLTGLYQRKKKRYDLAEKEFDAALKIRPNSLSAKNELAIAYQRQLYYDRALDLAEECFETQSTNPYYIVTYFKSLVRQKPANRPLLKELITKLDSAWGNDNATYAKMLQAEYLYFVDGNFDKAIDVYDAALEENPIYPVFKSLHEICTKEKRNDISRERASKFKFESDQEA